MNHNKDKYPYYNLSMLFFSLITLIDRIKKIEKKKLYSYILKMLSLASNIVSRLFHSSWPTPIQ